MTRFSVIESVDHVTQEYRRFIKSSYRLADPHLRAQFERQVDQAEVLVKGPYLTLARDFAQGPPLAELLAAGIGHPDLKRLCWPFASGPLFAHQEAALRAVEAGRNIVVKTGTGSGKTESFLLPVLSGVLRQRSQGVRGTKAILLYPMNALANDQLGRLRDLLRDTGSPITFALYTGDSETVGRALGEPLSDNELIRRDEIRHNPPDVLLTNYKQLEFLLVRKVDRALFSSSLRYLVLDELHSYRGALATEVACLLRRLKARCGLDTGELRCIGTSATVSQDAGGDAALAKFASELFAEAFNMEDIIGEAYALPPQPAAPYTPPMVAVTDGDLSSVSHEDEAAMLRLAALITGRPDPGEGTTHARLRAMLEGNRLIEALRVAMEVPRTLEEITPALRRELPSFADAQGLEQLVRAYLLVGSFGSDADSPLLRPKLHTFFHGVYDVGLCMNPACRTLVADGSETCPACGSAVRPAVLCRTCGQDFVKVRLDPEDKGKTLANDEFLSDDDTAFITSRLREREENEEEADEDAEDGVSKPPKPRHGASSRSARASARDRLTGVWVDHSLGRLYAEEPGDVGTENRSRQHILYGRGTTCPVCNSRYTRGDVLTLLRTGVASSVSVLATHHLDHLPRGERKLLVFADNRQDAAHQAGYMADRHRQFALRHAIESIVRDTGAEGIALESLPHRVLEVFQDIGIARRHLTHDAAKFWRQTIEYEVAGEFCRASQQRISLENLALVEVQYEFLDRVLDDPRFIDGCKRAGLSLEQGRELLRSILDFMRRRRAVSFSFYQRFLDPRRAPWSYLTDDPYFLTIAEHERNATFFMSDRPEALRSHSPSGIKFEPIIKDSKRGAPGGIARLVYTKAGLGEVSGHKWLTLVFSLLADKEIEIVEAPGALPDAVSKHIGGRRAWQIARRVIRLVPAGSGWRCQKCAVWRPYRTKRCYATTLCSADQADIRASQADRDNYYVRLYTADRPQGLRSQEHTAQIDQETRAKREQDFKEGRVEALVCSPTLELGVNIGQLYSVLLRNAPHTPASYVQRAGRAGRRLRIGFVSTFCGVGPHDRHCFEDPAWLVRGEFRPPLVRLSNDKIVARHVRSFALEELNEDFSWKMGNLLEDIQNPAVLKTDIYHPMLAALGERSGEITERACKVFGDTLDVANVVARLPEAIDATIQRWHLQVMRLHREFQYYARIVPTRESEQKRRARLRAYGELTTSQEKAFSLTYFADTGLLPSYQFPTDTFALDPGTSDTPTLRRPAWIALFEFAPGNMVYANGHKLKSIRAFFEGGPQSMGRDAGGESSGRVEQYCFCSECGFASREVVNSCPSCGTAMGFGTRADVALIDSFEAEENTQITSAEDARQRLTFERREHLLDGGEDAVTVYPYEFVALEHRARAELLVTNWGKQTRWGAEGEQFDLCPACGRHRPHGLSARALQSWDESHHRICNADPRRYVLGYAFTADVLILPVAAQLIPADKEMARPFCRTLANAMAVGAQEVLEIEADEIAYFSCKDGKSAWTIAFYETAPGGAGYLQQLADKLPKWAHATHDRLFGHECDRACYRCLKSARNQYDHAILDKELVRDTVFHLCEAQTIGGAYAGKAGEGRRVAAQWLSREIPSPKSVHTSDTPIEKRLRHAIEEAGRLPPPVEQYEVRENGQLLTIPDFAYPDRKLAIYCDGFAYHGDVDVLGRDAHRRNALQAKGWAVLVFWGRQILRDAHACESQIWMCYQHRRESLQ